MTADGTVGASTEALHLRMCSRVVESRPLAAGHSERGSENPCKQEPWHSCDRKPLQGERAILDDEGGQEQWVDHSGDEREMGGVSRQNAVAVDGGSKCPER